MTIHEAKGLGFPVVLLPDIANGWAPRKNISGPVVWHDGQRRVLNISSQGIDRARAIESHEEDERGENLRLLYVALTRARSAVRLWWSPCSRRNRWSAFQRLVKMDRSTGELGLGRAGTDPGTLPWLNSGPITTAIAPANQKQLTRASDAEHQSIAAPRSLTRPLDLDFVRTSYSGLTAELHGSVLTPLPTTLTDEPEDDESPTPLHQVSADSQAAPPSAHWYTRSLNTSTPVLQICSTRSLRSPAELCAPRHCRMSLQQILPAAWNRFCGLILATWRRACPWRASPPTTDSRR